MDFAREETQTTVAEMVTALLARGEPNLHDAMADAGLFSMLLPESLGGDGLGVLDAAAVLTELAAAAAVGPELATIGFGIVPLVTLADPSLVERIVTPGCILTAALMEPGSAFPTRPSTKAEQDGDGLRITGKKIAVPYAEHASRILVPTSSGVVLVDPAADGVHVTRTPASGDDPEYAVEFDRTAGEFVTNDLAGLHRCALAAIGAVADGLAAGAVDLTARHLAHRRQFGKPLATFQAVAGEIADVYVTARTLHVAAASVAWQASTNSPGDDSDVLAYWIANELPTAMQMCHHLHGGVGVDATYPMHRYFSAAQDLARFVGGASYRLDLVGAACSSN